MKSMTVFLLVVTSLIFSTVFILSLLGVESIQIYVDFFAAEFIVTSEFTPPLSQSEEFRKHVMATILSVVFTGTVIEQIMELLGYITVG